MVVVKTPLSPVARSADPPGWTDASILPPGARAVARLTVMGCRWPIGEIDNEGFRFCGHLRERGSYCPAHRRLAYAGGVK